jgi:hypothetical protein
VAGVTAPAAERFVCGLETFAIADDRVWAFFSTRGGVPVFGCPISRLFTLDGLATQFFERRIIQLDEGGQPRLLNLLDPEYLPYTHINGATLPAIDATLKSRTPPVTSPTYVPDLLELITTTVPDEFAGMPVRFQTTFFSLVTPAMAGTSDPSAVAMENVTMWGAPTSAAQLEPSNASIVYQRFQRQLMAYDAACNCTQSPLLAIYLKDMIVGNPLPPDLEQEAASSRLYHQYAPDSPLAVRDPTLLPGTNLTNAFSPP